MNFWNNFAAKHPAAAKWVREGGLFVIVSNLITVFKYLLLQFLPKAFASLPVVDFGWPGIDITLFGETFKWNILGYDAAHGGLPYFCAYMVAMIVGECINFPIQRSFVFRSKGNLAKQIGWYVLAFCVITCIVNSINCIWVAVAGLLVPDFIYNIGTTVLNGGISMIIFFFVNKIIFPEGEAKMNRTPPSTFIIFISPYIQHARFLCGTGRFVMPGRSAPQKERTGSGKRRALCGRFAGFLCAGRGFFANRAEVFKKPCTLMLYCGKIRASFQMGK